MNQRSRAASTPSFSTQSTQSGHRSSSKMRAYTVRMHRLSLGGSMRRREFIGWMGTAALGLPRPGVAQTKIDLPVVGFLVPPKLDTKTAQDRISDIRKGLSEEGYVEGTNYSLVVRSSEGNPA